MSSVRSRSRSSGEAGGAKSKTTSLPAGIDQRSPARHPDWLGPDDLALKIEEVREATNWEIPIQLKLGAARVYDDVRMAAKTGKLPVPNFTAGGIATPADAALMMQLAADAISVGSGFFMNERARQLDVEHDARESRKANARILAGTRG